MGNLGGNGTLDLSVAHLGGVSVLLNNGDGTFQSAINSSCSCGGSEGLALGDLNSDGRPDAVVPHLSPHGFTVLPSNGDGTLGPAAGYGFSGPPQGGVAIGDVNKDAHLDVLVVNGNNQLLVYLGSATGALTFLIGYIGFEPRSITLGDLNGDGSLDMVHAGSWLHIWLGNGDGTFVSTGIPENQAGPAAIGDLDRDGILDVAAALGSFGLAVFAGNGDGSFTAAGNFPTDGAGAVALGDLNHDGLLDAVLPNQGYNTVSVLLNTTPVDAASSRPSEILVQSYPNPARSDLIIQFVLPQAGHVRLGIYDVAGRAVQTLVEGVYPAGVQAFRWDRRTFRGRPAAPGVYFYKLETHGREVTSRVTLLR